MPPKPQSKGGSKILLEYAPLILFFIVNAKFGILWGTATLVVSTIIVLGISWAIDRRISKILAFGCGAVILFGALTLIFEDETFIKLKPTIVSLILAGGLLLGQLLKKNLLKSILGEAIGLPLSDVGWRKLTNLWILMFTILALANELAWRNLSTDGWVAFKTFGLTGITLVFGVVMAIYLSRFSKSNKDQKG